MHGNTGLEEIHPCGGPMRLFGANVKSHSAVFWLFSIENAAAQLRLTKAYQNSAKRDNKGFWMTLGMLGKLGN
jgi:hypothetical protein